jgi:hypothetical protein
LRRDTSDATAPQRTFSHPTTQAVDKPKPVFPSPPWQEAQVKPERNKKEIKNEAAIKHMDHADSWFSVVRADYPGRTDSIEE